MFCEDTPTSPEVIVANTLNFEPNFKISGLKFLGETRPTSGVGYQCLGNLQSLNFMAQHPLGAEV